MGSKLGTLLLVTGFLLLFGLSGAWAQEGVNLEEKVAALEKRVDSLEKRTEALQALVAQLLVERGGTQDKVTKKEAGPPIPKLGDETRLTMVEANTRDYIGKTFILVGGVSVWDIYSSAYRDAKGTHVSLNFGEVRQDRTFTGKNVTLYVRRDKSEPLVEIISGAIGQGTSPEEMSGVSFVLGTRGRAVYPLIRAKVTIFPERYSDSARDAELVDWQFLDKETNTWGPWALSAK